jgi:hypothetical protein
MYLSGVYTADLSCVRCTGSAGKGASLVANASRVREPQELLEGPERRCRLDNAVDGACNPRGTHVTVLPFASSAPLPVMPCCGNLKRTEYDQRSTARESPTHPPPLPLGLNLFPPHDLQRELLRAERVATLASGGFFEIRRSLNDEIPPV